MTYLVNNKETIMEELSIRLIDPLVVNKFRIEYDEAVVSEIIQIVMSALNLNYEQVASVITIEVLRKLQ
jgi:hypothetical protein